MRTWNAPSFIKPGSTDYFTVGDSLSDLPIPAFPYRKENEADWAGCTYEQAVRFTMDGNPALVERSNAIMAEIEARLPELFTGKHESVNDVVGAVPDVARFLAGNPYSMKRRRKSLSEDKPIAVVVTLAIHAPISAKIAMERGAAILALVRVLAGQRPVSLYGFKPLGHGESARDAAYYLWRVETAPLELSRAAWEIAHPAVLRQLFVCGVNPKLHDNTSGDWPYAKGSKGFTYITGENMKPLLQYMAPELPETLLFIPGIKSDDPLLNDPIKWVLERIMETRQDHIQ